MTTNLLLAVTHVVGVVCSRQSCQGNLLCSPVVSDGRLIQSLTLLILVFTSSICTNNGLFYFVPIFIDLFIYYLYFGQKQVVSKQHFHCQ